MRIIQPRADVIVRCRVEEGLQIGWKQEARRTTKQGRRRCARATSSDFPATGSGLVRSWFRSRLAATPPRLGLARTDTPSTPTPPTALASTSWRQRTSGARDRPPSSGPWRRRPSEPSRSYAACELRGCQSGRRWSERARRRCSRSGRSSSGCPDRRGRRVRAASPSSRVVWPSSFRRYWQVVAIVLHGTDRLLAFEPIQLSVTLLDHDPRDRLPHRRRDRPR